MANEPDLGGLTPSTSRDASPARSRALADARYLQVQSLTRGVLTAVQALWVTATPDRILAAMAGEVGAGILNAVLAGQLAVAQGASAFVANAMLAQGASPQAAGLLVPGQLAGYAADGRALATLLYLPALTTARALARGVPVQVASVMGLNQMARLVSTTLADTARTATTVAMTATERCVSYVRVVKLPACDRCIILAGRQYTYSEGFKRHPGCDCGMEPMTDREWKASNGPKELYAAMTPEERIRRFGKDAVEAMEAGADMAQVVNVTGRKGGVSTVEMFGKKVQVTREGTTKRGLAAASMQEGFKKVQGERYTRTNAPRLTPSEILRQAKGDREHQIRLLTKYGYIQ
ncbi:capsid maturation protease [Streptomyces phage Nesbitt]|uniref:Capsid maturation protease n=1 Tax=Streptomyces phage Nesbitt TaxID=2108133 RepID=A0A2P1JT02_9CAUD|nr:capsid maturation protease [Streptomyces phage Nesbitt]